MFFRDTTQRDISHALGFLMAVADGSKFCCLKAEGGWFSRDEYQCFKSTDHAAITHWLTEQYNQNRNVSILLHRVKRYLDFVRPNSIDFDGTRFIAYRFFDRTPKEICEIFSPAPTVVLSAKSGNYACYGLVRSWDMTRHVNAIKARASYMKGEAEASDWAPLPFLGASMSVAWDAGNFHPHSAFLSGKESEPELEREMAQSMYAPVVLSAPAQAEQYRPAPQFDTIGVDDEEADAQCAADVDMRPLEWYWRGVIAKRKLNFFGGQGGQGKSQMTIMVAAIMSNGGVMPCGTKVAPVKTMILFSEDGSEDTIVPRLKAAGANLKNVIVSDDEYNLKTPEGRAKLMRYCEKHGVHHIIFDPINPFFPTDAPGIRKSTKPLLRWGSRQDVTFTAILHPKPGVITNEDHLFGSSRAFKDLGRSCWFATRSETPGESLFLYVKGNLADDADKRGYRYRIVGDVFEHNGHRFKTSHIQVFGRADMTAAAYLENGEDSSDDGDDARRPSSSRNHSKESDGPAVERAKEFLREELRTGPKELAFLRSKAGEIGIYPTPLYAAKNKMHLRETGVEGSVNNGVIWGLPH